MAKAKPRRTGVTVYLTPDLNRIITTAQIDAQAAGNKKPTKESIILEVLNLNSASISQTARRLTAAG